MNHPMTSSIRSGFALLGITLVSTLHAETLVQYDFTSSATAVTATGSNVVTQSFAKGAGLTSTTLSSTGFPSVKSIFVTSAQVDDQTALPANNDWLGFTISAEAGYKLNLSSLSFYYGYSNTSGTISGSATFDVRSSAVNDYGTSIWSGSLNVVNSTSPNWTLASIGLSAVSYQGLDTVSFRIYLNDGANTSTNSQLRIDTVALSGVSSNIPEPSTYALVAGVGGLVGAGFRRRRNRTS
jgi:hypothetical protein